MSGERQPDDPTASPGSPAATPAGWFDDPHGKHDLRYWDGSAWSEHVHDRDPMAPQVQTPARAAAVAPSATAATPTSTATGLDGRKWAVLIAVVLLIGAVTLVATSLSGSDSASVIDSTANSAENGEGTSVESGAANGAGNSSSPTVAYTASVEAANTNYGSISDQIAVAGGFVWVISPEAVTVLDESTGEFVDSIPVESTDAAGLFADDDRVWLISPLTKTLTVVSADSRTVEGEVVLSTGGHRPNSGLLLTDEYAWVPNGNVAVSDTPGSDIIEVIDTTTLSVVGQVEVAEGASHLLLADGKIWMVNSLSNEVTVIDIDTISVVATIPSGDFPSDIAYADGLIWVANARGATVSVIDPASLEVIDEISLGSAMTPDDQQFPGPRVIHGVGGSVWITMSQDQSLKVIDTTTREVIDSLPVTGKLGFTEDTVWVAEGTEVEAIDLATHESMGSVSGGIEFVLDMTSTADGTWVISEDNTISKLTLGRS